MDDIECTCGSDYMGYETHSRQCEANPDYVLGDRFDFPSMLGGRLR